MFPIPLKSLNDQERHDYILKTYVLNKSQKHKRDIDIIKENHRFIHTSDKPDSWEKRIALRYYEKLFKEYAISDLSHYKDNKVALRWRVEAEVISGKGQFQCGNRKCEEREGLKSWEVNFAYLEEGQRKNALVKLRLCPEHSGQLNYTSRKREIKRLKRNEKLRKKEMKRQSRKTKKEEKSKKSSDDEEESTNDTVEIKELEPVKLNASVEENSDVGVKEDAMESIWSKKLEITSEERTREMEFEEYLEDLLL